MIYYPLSNICKLIPKYSKVHLILFYYYCLSVTTDNYHQSGINCNPNCFNIVATLKRKVFLLLGLVRPCVTDSSCSLFRPGKNCPTSAGWLHDIIALMTRFLIEFYDIKIMFSIYSSLWTDRQGISNYIFALKLTNYTYNFNPWKLQCFYNRWYLCKEKFNKANKTNLQPSHSLKTY